MCNLQPQELHHKLWSVTLVRLWRSLLTMPWSKFVPDLHVHILAHQRSVKQWSQRQGSIQLAELQGVYNKWRTAYRKCLMFTSSLHLSWHGLEGMSNKFAHGWRLSSDLRNLEGSEANSGEFEPQLGRSAKMRWGDMHRKSIGTTDHQSTIYTSSVSILPAKNPDATLD